MRHHRVSHIDHNSNVAIRKLTMAIQVGNQTLIISELCSVAVYVYYF
jgi:hypothetical protein